MVPKHKSLQGIWDEWHGIGQYPNSEGGIKGRNKAHGSKWRKHLNAQHYSHTYCVVDAIKTFTSQENIKASPFACEVMNLWYIDCKMSVGNMVTKCQEMGLIPKKAHRGQKQSLSLSESSTLD
jgi:hypothetical protein